MSQLEDDHADGSGIAAFELVSTLIRLLLLQGAIPKPLTLEMIEQSIERVERLQAGLEAQAGGKSDLTGPMQAARLQLTLLQNSLRALPVPE